jgi:hypothetical protein
MCIFFIEILESLVNRVIILYLYQKKRVIIYIYCACKKNNIYYIGVWAWLIIGLQER